jgi:cytochrome oxidase assembly protein ShyY1
MEKLGHSPSSSQASRQSGCAILAFAVAAVPAILTALGMIRLVI